MSSSSLARDSVVDALRSIAIVMMVLSHTARIIDKDIRPAWGEWILLYDPWPQALFLGLVGASLVLSLSAHRVREDGSSWVSARVRRAGELYLLSMVLFFFDRGAQWPHLVTDSGILATIAVAIVVYTPVALSSRPMLPALGMTLGLLGLAAGLDQGEVLVPWLNTGNAPLLPNVIWTGVGFLCFQALHDGKRWVLWLMAGLSVVLSGVLLTRYGFFELLNTPVGRDEMPVRYQGRSHGLANTWDMISGAKMKTKKVTYFNPTLLSMPISALLTVGTYWLLRRVEPLLDKVRGNVLLIGRYSLGVYIFHLIVLAITVIITGESRPLDAAAAAWAFGIGILALCWGYAFVRHGMVKRKKAAAAAAAAG